MNFDKGPSTVELPFGQIAMDGELPAREAVTKLFDQLDFQQACQTYLWALPLVAFAQWKHTHEHVFGAKNGDIVYYETYEDKLGIPLANATTPYIFSFLDLFKSGPMVVEIAEKGIEGVFCDSWQRIMSAAKDAGGKVILLPPGSEPPEDADGYKTLTSTTMNAVLALRVFEKDKKKAMEQVQNVKIYPFAQRSNPPATHVVSPCGKKYHVGQPRGIAYWQRLHAILQEEVVEDRDRFFMGMLHYMGIDKGKAFDLTEQQRQMLIQGAEAGELLAKVNTFSKRFEGVKPWPDREWTSLAVMANEKQAVDNYEQLNERSCYYYQTIMYSNSINLKAPAMGQIFLGVSTDGKGSWLDGSKTYTLHLAPNPPAKIYWSLSVYDVDTRTLISNEQRKADIFSKRDDVALNEDDSISVLFGPKAPTKAKDNWLQTIPGRHWFAYLRLCHPLQTFFDKSWKMGNIEELK